MVKKQNNKIFAFRWDIDHLYGLEKGVPRILDLCKKIGVKNSFYINLGHSVNLSEWLLRSPSKSIGKLSSKNSINIIKKVGIAEVLRALFIQRNVGLERVDILKRIIGEGHELGLHGIFDHIVWSRRLDSLSQDFIENEVKKAICFFEDKLGFKPNGFAAPGFKWNQKTLNILDKFFNFSGDLSGNEPFRVKLKNKVYKHLQIPVTVIGPDTVPLIEFLLATGKTEAEIIAAVEREILKQDFSVMYGHPCLEGMKTEVLEKIFKFVLENNYQFLTIEQIYERYTKNSSLAVRSL